MGRRAVLLVNPNFMRPPIAPIGLEYLAADLAHHQYEPVLCDLAFAADWPAAVSDALERTTPLAVGVSVRNIDDAYFASQDFVLEKTAGVVHHILEVSDVPVVLGGVGFSAMPREVLEFTHAHYGIVGDGERAFPALLECIESGADLSQAPGAVFRAQNNRIMVIPPSPANLDCLPTRSRRFLDNPRYFRQGGQGGLETKRGCDRTCIYCMEPQAKGRRLRVRSPENVAAEFEDLLNQGINVVHICDSEFNLPVAHAYAVCHTLVRRGLAQHLRWYTYAAPQPFDTDLAQIMARAGCVGIDFGIDHTDEEMLRRLGRDYAPDAIRRIAHACRKAGLTILFDLLLGSPGETPETIERTIDLMRAIDPDRVGLSCGVRVYPHTPLARLVRAQGPLAENPNLHGAKTDNENLLRPIFYVESAIGCDIHRLVWSLVKDDNRFFAANPNEIDRNYNYNDNSVLADAIAAGERGAYWDILRRIAHPRTTEPSAG